MINKRNPLSQIHKNNTSKKCSSFFSEICVVTSILLAFTFLFKVYTSDKKYYESDNCVELLSWSKIIFSLFMIGILIIGFIMPILFLLSYLFQSNENCATLSMLLINLIKLGFFVAFIIVLVAYFNAFFKNEPCGSLRTLALVYLVITCVLFGIVLLVRFFNFCCPLVFGGSPLLGLTAASQEIQNYNSIKNGNVGV